MKEFRAIIIEKFCNGEKAIRIYRDLMKYGVKKEYVYFCVRRYRATGNKENFKKPGKKRTVRTPAVIKVVRERIRRNCERSANQLAKDMKMSRYSMQKLLKEDLKCKPLKKRKMHGITTKCKVKRHIRSKMLLSWHAGDEIVFSDEKLFVLQMPVSVQNDRLWCPSVKLAPANKRNICRYQSASAVMVWGAISSRGKLPLIFIDKGVKINAQYYLNEVLMNVVKPATTTMYGNDYFCFQQDGAPSHTAKIVQAWCTENLPDFISKDEWPPSSPDLNPLDFCIWGYMLKELKNYSYTTISDFKIVIAKIWDKIPDHVVRASVSSFEKRLKLVVQAKGDFIE